MYILIGRTKDYAWSLTSAGHDVRDVFAERLCNLDGSPATRTSNHYRYNGECRAFDDVNAGTLNGTPLRYKSGVHGPVIGTATIDGKFYSLSRKRSTFGRDGLNLAALHDMTEAGFNTQKFWDAVNQFGFTFNWAYVSRRPRRTSPPAACPGARRDSTAVCRRSATETSSGEASSARTSIRTTWPARTESC